MIYQPPSIEHREAIEQAFVLGATQSVTITPTWTDQSGENPA